MIDQFLDSPDKRERIKRADGSYEPWVGIVIHHTGNSVSSSSVDDPKWKRLFDGAVSWLTLKDDSYASAHFILARNGICCQLVDPSKYIAFHAGLSQGWHPEKRVFVKNCNWYYIGIEFVGRGDRELFSDHQYRAAARLCAGLLKQFPTIQPHCIVGHNQVSPGRKTDPDKYFDWQKFYKELYSEILKT